MSVQTSLPLGPLRPLAGVKVGEGEDGASRGRRGDPGDLGEGREADPVMAKAGRILSRRSHSVAELRDKLWAAGIAQDDIDRTLERLTELKLLDDLEFARRWVDERSRTKGLAAAALLHELEAKGVATEIAEQAIDEAGLDEDARAKELAAGYLRKVSGKPPLVQAQRIQGMLLRKGFSMDAAVAGAKAVLPPEGWD
jgi:regulatory protein